MVETLKGVTGRLNTYIDGPEDLEGRQVRVHWHFNEKRYSVSVRASNGRWYVVRDRATGAQLFFGKLVLMNARFKVQHAAAIKAWHTNKRTVHANVIGTVKSAQFKPEPAFVPCGMNIMYSHNLYSDPEFKALDRIIKQKSDIASCPGVDSAEFVAMGCGPMYNRRPNMLGVNVTYTKGY